MLISYFLFNIFYGVNNGMNAKDKSENICCNDA